MQFKKRLSIGIFFAFLVVFSPLYSNSTTSYAEQEPDVLQCIEKGECNDSKSTDADAEERGSASVGLSTWDYVKTLLALIFVVGLMYALLKFLNRRNLKYQHNQIVQNIGGLTLGAQKSVQLLQVGDTVFLVGVGEDVQLLKEFTDPKQIESIKSMYNDKQEFAAASPYIAELLSKLKRNNSTPKEDGSRKEVMFRDILGEKISVIKKERSKELEKWKQKETDDHE